MAKKPKIDRKKAENRTESLGTAAGVSVLTDGGSGVYLDGAEKVIEMYENGELSQQDLYNSIMDLEVVFKNVESTEV
jgi:hypothetical protein